MAAPSAGLALMLEKPSEPPHCSPMLRWLALTGSRRTALAWGSSASISPTPWAMVSRVPPMSCMSKGTSSGPLASPWLSSRSAIWLRSQPRPTTSTAARLAWRAKPASVRRKTSKFRLGVDMPQPVLWVKATTPSTLG